MSALKSVDCKVSFSFLWGNWVPVPGTKWSALLSKIQWVWVALHCLFLYAASVPTGQFCMLH